MRLKVFGDIPNKDVGVCRQQPRTLDSVSLRLKGWQVYTHSNEQWRGKHQGPGPVIFIVALIPYCFNGGFKQSIIGAVFDDVSGCQHITWVTPNPLAVQNYVMRQIQWRQHKHITSRFVLLHRWHCIVTNLKAVLLQSWSMMGTD